MDGNKVLFITHYSTLYGSNMSLYSLVRYFRDKGKEVSVLFPSKGILYDRMKEDGIEVLSIRFFYNVLYIRKSLKFISIPLLWLYDLLVFPYLVYRVSKINPDIIYTNSSVNIFGLWIAKLLKKQHVQHVREFMQEDFGSYFVFGKSVKKKHILKSDKIIYVSKAVAEVVTGGLPKQGAVIYNGVRKPSQFHAPKTIGKDFRLGVVGYFEIAKQQHLAVEYFSELKKIFPEATLHFVGERKSSYKNHVKKMVQDFNLSDSVVFEGFIKDEDIIYDKFDILLMCSRMEAFGRVTVEAMRRNIPVIGFDSGGTSELIVDGETGYKFRTYSDVLAAINAMIDHPEKEKEIVENARIYADREFAEELYSERVYNFIFNS